MPKDAAKTIAQLQLEVTACNLCPRLQEHCLRIAEVKRKAYKDWTYWGKPVPSFGAIDAKVLLIGLAPGAHGANRTGRMFTGDRSGDFLYKALHETGFANQPTSETADDGLKLIDCYITAPVRCAPPDNKPTTEEFARCRPFLERELVLLTQIRVVVVLGGLALRTYLGVLKDIGRVNSLASHPFGHGRVHRIAEDLPVVLCCYHPSQQNTQTGRLTADMMRQTMLTARQFASLPSRF